MTEPNFAWLCGLEEGADNRGRYIYPSDEEFGPVKSWCPVQSIEMELAHRECLINDLRNRNF